MPRAFIGSRGQRKPNGVLVLFFQQPSHIPSLFEVLISKPERFLKEDDIDALEKDEDVEESKQAWAKLQNELSLKDRRDIKSWLKL